MKDNVHYLPAHCNLKVDEAFTVAMRNNLKDVLIIGDDQNNNFVSITSHMTRADALFLLEKAKMHVMGI